MNRRISEFLWEAWLPITLLVAWWFVSAASTSFYFPSLALISENFFTTWFGPGFLQDVVPSLTRFFVGFMLALIIGIGLGLTLGTLRGVERAVRPIVEFFRSTPSVAVLPIMMIILGLGTEMKIGIIAFASLWPVLLNTIDGVRAVEPQLREVAVCYRLTRWDRFRYIILPTASPQIFAGARTSLAVAVIAMVISEILGTPGGIGYFIMASQRAFDTPAMWSGILALGIIGYALNKIFAAVEKQALGWHKGMQTQIGGNK
jgi:ABC-type nitrate/sulfonate/bicarbonate transport system permease component